MIENYKQSPQYSYLNIAFKVFIFILFFLSILFFFKIDIFNLKFFKSNDHKDKKYVHKAYNVNRNLVNAISSPNYQDKKLSHFYIKTSYNSCNIGYGNANVERLKTIISQGFRCLDFELIYKNNTLHVKNQPKNETFYNALEVIDSHAFTNSHCHNNEDPLIINIRLSESAVKSPEKSKLVYKKLREMFRTLNSSHMLGTEYSLLEYLDNNNNYQDILSQPLTSIKQKMIVMCNYDYAIANNGINDKHELLQYIHFNTYVPEDDNTYDLNSVNISGITDVLQSSLYNSALISMETHIGIVNNSGVTDMVTTNVNYPIMITPKITSDNLNVLENPSSLHDIYGYTFRAMDFSSISNFENDIPDSDINIYIDEFDIVGSAFILKPINYRPTEE